MEKRKGMIIGGLICAILAVGGTMAAIGYNQKLEKPATQEAQTVTDADTKEPVTEEPDMTKEQEASNNDEKKEKADKKEQSKEATTESTQAADTDNTKPQAANTGNTKPQTSNTGNTKPQTASTDNTKPQTVNTQPVGQTSQPTTGTPAPEQATQPVTTTADTPAPEQTTQPVTGTNDVQTASTTQENNKVWVVDEPAWDETYEVYETRVRMVCYVCGGYMYTQADIDNHPCFGGWHDEVYQVCVGTETVHHEEVGHWEWQ